MSKSAVERANEITIPPSRGADGAAVLRYRIAAAIRAAVTEAENQRDERAATIADGYAAAEKLTSNERLVASWIARDIRKKD